MDHVIRAWRFSSGNWGRGRRGRGAGEGPREGEIGFILPEATAVSR